MVGKCSAGFPPAEIAASPGWRVGGVGSERGAEGEARPWESQGQSGKAREGQRRRRTEPEECNMGGGELKEPWGIRGRAE